MIKVLFYTENNWCYGKIHNDLIKALYPEIYCDILDWSKNYSIDDFVRFSKKYDYFLTSLSTVHLLCKQYKVNPQKIIASCHADRDIIDFTTNNDKDEILSLAGYFVISEKLQETSVKIIPRIPDILKIGSFTNNYPKNENNSIKNIGYFSVPDVTNNVGINIKRGHLIKEVSEKMNIPIVHYTNAHFLGVEDLYSDVSLLMSASLTEGWPYIALEAYSCGIPILSTNVGVFSEETIRHGGGHILPFKETEYVTQACSHIEKINNDKELYLKLRNESYNIGQKYDWHNLKNSWLDYFNLLGAS